MGVGSGHGLGPGLAAVRADFDDFAVFGVALDRELDRPATHEAVLDVALVGDRGVRQDCETLAAVGAFDFGFLHGRPYFLPARAAEGEINRKMAK